MLSNINYKITLIKIIYIIITFVILPLNLCDIIWIATRSRESLPYTVTSSRIYYVTMGCDFYFHYVWSRASQADRLTLGKN